MKLSELIRQAGKAILAHGDMEVLIEAQEETGVQKVCSEQAMSHPGHPRYFFIYAEGAKEP